LSDSDNFLLPDDLLKELYQEAKSENQIESTLPLYNLLKKNEDRYLNREPIASGAMKEIHRVFDKKTNRHVAMAKLINYTNRDLYEPFLREALLTSCLDHPNIITVFDTGIQDNGQPYFTMELKVGDSLDAYLIGDKKEPLALSQYLDIFIKICEAMAYAHSQGVLHLDLKPANIQVGHYGEVLVCDWGLGKCLGSNHDTDGFEAINPDIINHLTLNGEIKGTPGYMAPEQTIPNSNKTIHTDIYSLGCILYTMLCKTTPIEASSGDEILKKTQAGEITMPINRFPGLKIPTGLNAIVEKAMHVDPQNRYESIERLKEDVGNYINGYATLAENAGFIKEFQLFYKRNFIVSFVVLVAIATLLIFSSIFIIKLDNEKQNALNALSRADKALNLYHHEKEHAQDISKKYSKYLIEQNRFLPKSLNNKNVVHALHTALDRLEIAIENSNYNKDLVDNQLKIYFTIQNFNGYIQKYDQYKNFYHSEFIKSKNKKKYNFLPNHNLLIQLSKKYHISIKDNQTLNAIQLSELLLALDNKKIHQTIMKSIILYDLEVRSDFNHYEKVIQDFLKLNPSMKNSVVSYDSKTQSLTLSGKNINQKMWHLLSIFKGLPVIHLNISNTQIYNVRELYFKNLETLDLRNSLLRNTNVFRQYKKLKTVILTPGQYPLLNSNKKLDHIDFIEKD
jgi:serine/threonine protein kinase